MWFMILSQILVCLPTPVKTEEIIKKAYSNHLVLLFFSKLVPLSGPTGTYVEPSGKYSESYSMMMYGC